MTKRKFRAMLEDILSVPAGSLDDGATRQSLGSWTSLADVQILVVMASELGLDDAAETIEYESIGQLLAELDERGAFAPA
jgi:hypothetical protein